MAIAARTLDPAFLGAGQRVGTEIWRIENFQPVPLPKTNYSKFYSGDSYIVLQTTAGKGGSYIYDIHFWIGKSTSQDEAGAAAIKCVELDASLGGRAIQHRELQGFESDKFLSYFRPCLIPLEGGVASGFKKVEEDKFETRLYICKGKRAVRLKQVPFARSSLNHDDVFILDTENKIYQFNGANSNIQERAKALEVIQHLKDAYHKGNCEVAIIDDGKLAAESNSGDFWVLLGGFAPIGRKASNEDDVAITSFPGKLYSIIDGLSKIEEDLLSKSMLENNKCYLLDCGAETFVWVGRATQVEERKIASQAAEEFIKNQNRPKSTRITCVIQGHETQSFKSNFDSWPIGTGTPSTEDGRGKVAALLKQQGVDVKAGSKTTLNDETPPLLQGDGKIEVWLINGNAKTPIQTEDTGKFFSGDCYIVLYTHQPNDKRDEYFLACWMGKDSIQDDREMASRLANTMCNSLRGRPVLSRIMQGKEPPQFIAIFQPMVVLKGGMSLGYKNMLADKKMNDDTYTSENIALFQISNTARHNNKVLQVNAVATSLCSSDCFLLQSGSTFYTWHGNSSTYEQQDLVAEVAEYLKPGAALKLTKEGTETSAFWFALGGKQIYTNKTVTQEIFRDPHLYTFSLEKGKLKVSEVFNFCQDDLLPEDILILDTHAEVFLWVGQSVDQKEKQNVFDIGQKYIELAMNSEGLSPDVPLYKITEGNEPNFFTTYFSWDNTKAAVPGNSFIKKFSLLFGTASHGSESSGKTLESDHSGPTQRASAWAALSTAFNARLSQPETTGRPLEPQHDGPTQRASALAALTSAFNPSSTRTVSSEKSNPPNQSGPTQRASAMAALTSAFNPTSTQASVPKPVRSVQGSQRAAAVAALSNVLTSESPARFSRSPSPVHDRKTNEIAHRKTSTDQSPKALADRKTSGDHSPEVITDRKTSGDHRPEVITDRKTSEDQSPEAISDEKTCEDPSPVVEDDFLEKESAEETNIIRESNNAPSEKNLEEQETNENGAASVFSYARLKASSSNPVKGIDYKRREAYLSDSEFQTVFGIQKEKFYTQPQWKQDLQKRKLDLF